MISGDKMNERQVASPIRRTVTARPLALAIEGGLAIATLQRPPVNAINEEWLTCLEQALDSVERADQVRVLWIRSSEPNFCAGADLEFLRAHFATAEGRKKVIDFTRRLQAAYARLESMDVVTLAEIGGAALGGGLELALACDLRVVAEGATVGLPEARLGLLPAGGGTQRLTRIVGEATSRRLILGAEVINGVEAVALGLAHWVVPAARLESFVRDTVQRIAELPKTALIACKHCIAAALDDSYNGFEEELLNSAALLALPETQELVREFLEKRTAPKRAAPVLRRDRGMMEGVQLSADRLALEKERGIWTDRVITEYFDRWVVEKPDAVAVIAFRAEEATTTRLTWRELADAVGCIAEGLAARGVVKGDVVSFQLPNWWEFVAIHLACVRLGAVSNPLMPIFRQHEMSFMVKHAEPKVLIAPARFRGFDHGALALQLKRESASLAAVFLVGGKGEHSFESEFLVGARDRRSESGTPLGPNDVMQLLYTSGTTGEPKGVLHTSNTLIGTVLQFTERMQLSAQDVVFMPSPMAHQAGFSYGLTLSILLGAPLVLMDIWNPARAVELMEAYRVAYTFAATPFLSDLVNFPDIEKRDLRAFRLFVTSGAAVPPVLVRQAQEKLRAGVVAAWGMTECCAATTTSPSGYKVLESDGCALPGLEVRIFDEYGNEAPRGQEGVLKFRGAALFVGYLKRPQLYSVDEQGWFDTGDIARMDEDGYIRICGRAKDIIIRGGENVPVVEIENAMYRMPEIAEVAIVAMPDPRMGERACAFVRLRQGKRITLEGVQKFLAAEGFSRHFWPEHVEVIEQMPRNPTGKVQKFVLREAAKQLVGNPRALAATSPTTRA